MSARVASAFEAALEKQQSAQLTHDDLRRLYYKPAHPRPLTALSDCRFYEDFAASPEDANKKAKCALDDAVKSQGRESVDAILESQTHHPLRRRRTYDLRLSEPEEARLAQLGFAVSERLHAKSFAEVYYRLYSDDMPVFITSDSVLHAWHRSFDAFLVELEEQELSPLLERVLDGVAGVCDRPSAPNTSVFQDVKTFFNVALCLLREDSQSSGAAVSSLIKAIENEKLTQVDLFGSTREVDFSLFKPRGHYNKTKALTRFFRAMTWLGTVDLRIDGTEDSVSELHQLQCACAVLHALREANMLESVRAFHTIVSSIAGDGFGSDSMTPMELDELVGDRDLVSLYLGTDSEAALRNLQDEIANHGLGTQAIAGHPLTESLAAASSPSRRTRLPTAFAFLGQQFVWSAFVFSKLVFDQVLHANEKIVRRIPSAVDVAFALFGNDTASSEIATRMAATPKALEDFVAFRDGLPYTSNLVAVRHVVDAQLASADPKSCSLALLWQLALRELSTPSASDASVFRSDAWQKRQMNTQIASLAQLRHDTILYAKQSFTMGTRCEYAAGFVDPYPSFWLKMQQLAERARDIVALIKHVNSQPSEATEDDEESPLQYKARYFFDNFVDVMRELVEISTAQATKQPLSEEQDDFIKRVMEERRGSGASRYLGWYPSLFYLDRKDSGKQDHVVADVHTDVPSVEHGDPGGILHLGVGDVNFGYFVVENVMYAGPVFSHYEFVSPINERWTDEEFSAQLGEFEAPRWATESFLVAK